MDEPDPICATNKNKHTDIMMEKITPLVPIIRPVNRKNKKKLLINLLN
jgi:hypothetical protein